MLLLNIKLMNDVIFDLRHITIKGMSYVTVQTISENWKIMFSLSRVMNTVVFFKSLYCTYTQQNKFYRHHLQASL